MPSEHLQLMVARMPVVHQVLKAAQMHLLVVVMAVQMLVQLVVAMLDRTDFAQLAAKADQMLGSVHQSGRAVRNLTIEVEFVRAVQMY
jgi:hypothetical protein